LPGLTRQSIELNSKERFLMDARVKPAHDESMTAAAGIIPAQAGIQGPLEQELL
jgi:hypothetical protein